MAKFYSEQDDIAQADEGTIDPRGKDLNDLIKEIATPDEIADKVVEKMREAVTLPENALDYLLDSPGESVQTINGQVYLITDTSQIELSDAECEMLAHTLLARVKEAKEKREETTHNS